MWACRTRQALVNLIAVAIVMVITTILVIGIKESANFNSAVVIIKVAIVGVFLVIGGWFLFQHPEIARANWHPFVPPPDGHGNFGWGGIPTAAASIFFAYIGFDAVSTAAQEAKNPKRDMPIGILGSLVVCTILYILVSLVLTGLVSYKTLNVSAPVALAIDATGRGLGIAAGEDRRGVWARNSNAGDAARPDPRLLLDVKRRTAAEVGFSGAPKVPHTVDYDDRVWHVCCNHAGVLQHRCALANSSTSALCSRSPSCAPACGYCVCAIRSMERPFKTPFVPLVPILGILSAVYLMTRLMLFTWEVMIGWLLIGLVIYFGYSLKHSKVQRLPEAQTVQGD